MSDHSRQREGSPPYRRYHQDNDNGNDNDNDNGKDNARRSSPRDKCDRDDLNHWRHQQSHHYDHRTSHHDQYQNYRDDYRTRQGKDLIRTMPWGRKNTENTGTREIDLP
ncbi:hypothetical protein SODALDRAFT_363210 [Sodiomyces alkalinus F11]|uniref:Btz domain-containing protein n=1 Tax=Sodiomyces alkalinus (strain CBS 110278 / VKM F-3762 / F11) TaxID=1314773 RepID=A0A3N2PLI6_SODAK|nr:hypothetical protein SODALDRAFT_363210 [Sodiomyces alkalinus F11]ROT35387.1 hypothetical protein SODALDRAFT_363210 [Sodiomyces alkalinus F11]